MRLTLLLPAGEVLFADVLLLPNGMSKVGVYTQRWLMLSLFLVLGNMWIDGLGRCPRRCRDAGSSPFAPGLRAAPDAPRIVEYTTREQAQQAVNTLSNQNLMGRLVYVREVGCRDKDLPSEPSLRVG